MFAMNSKMPEGFVSEAEYFTPQPCGNPFTATRAVSLGESIKIPTATGAPLCDTEIMFFTSETEMGFCEEKAPLFPPQPASVRAVHSRHA